MAISRETIDAAHDLLQRAPGRLDSHGSLDEATAYYPDVPHNAFPADCVLTPSDEGFKVRGRHANCEYSGELVQGANPDTYRRVILSFVKVPQAAAVLH